MSVSSVLSSYRVFTTDLMAAGTRASNIKAELSPVQLRYGWGLSKPGNARVTVQKRALGLKELRLEHIDANNTGLWIQRGSRLVWAGIIQELSADCGDNELTIEAVEFPAYLARYRFDVELALPGKTVLNLLELVSHQGNANGLPLTVRVSGSGSIEGAPHAPIWRTYENRYILDLIGEMQRVGQHAQPSGQPPVAGSTQGFEWAQGIMMTGEGGVTGAPRAELQVYVPTIGEDRTFPVVAWGAGTLETVRNCRWGRSGRRQANRVKFAGAGQGGEQQYAVATHASVGTTWPRLDTVMTDPNYFTYDQVTGAANDLLARVALPLVEVTCTVDEGEHWPWPLGATPPARIGDRLPVHIVDGDLYIFDGGLRITSHEVDVSGAGREQTHLSLQPWVPYSG